MAISETELRVLIERAQKGDEQALSQVREEFGKEPALWNRFSLAHSARVRLVRAITGDNQLNGEAIEHEAAALQRRLAGDNFTPLEEVLAERAVVCWLAVQYADNRAIEFFEQSQGVLCGLFGSHTQSDSFAQGDFMRRWQDSAHRRFLSACKTLATVRRLALPVLLAQVNVVQQQQIAVQGETPKHAPT